MSFLALNKPPGLTSHDCVAKVRRVFKLKRVGHGGTLDPMATGVLPIALGPSTRLLPYLPTAKAYQARIRLGQATDTDDITGTVISETDASHLNIASITQALETFHQGYDQIPPAYSAIQVNGKRLYHLARKGETVEIPMRWVDIFNIELLNWQPGPAPELEVAIDCGPGTYIRSIARDLGAVLGVGGTLASLIRTKSCGFDLANSVKVDTLNPATTPLIAPDQALAHLPELVLAPDLAWRWCCGQKLQFAGVNSASPHRVLTMEGVLLGIGQQEDECFRAKVVLPEALQVVTPNPEPTGNTLDNPSAHDAG